MEPQKETTLAKFTATSRLFCVTRTSKYLALALFVALPFLGGYVGYMNAPERVVEVERIVIQTVLEKDSQEIMTAVSQEEPALAVEKSTTTLWIVETKFGTKFLAEPNDFYQSSSYVSVSELELINFNYLIKDSQQSVSSENIFFVTARDTQNQSHFITVDTAQKDFSVVSIVPSAATEYTPGFSLSPAESKARLFFSACENCEPFIVDTAIIDVQTGAMDFIETNIMFEWFDGTYRYKLVPQNCEQYYGSAHDIPPSEAYEACKVTMEEVNWMVSSE